MKRELTGLDALKALRDAASPGLVVTKGDVRRSGMTVYLKHEEQRSANAANFEWVCALVQFGPDMLDKLIAARDAAAGGDS